MTLSPQKTGAADWPPGPQQQPAREAPDPSDAFAGMLDIQTARTATAEGQTEEPTQSAPSATATILATDDRRQRTPPRARSTAPPRRCRRRIRTRGQQARPSRSAQASCRTRRPCPTRGDPARPVSRSPWPQRQPPAPPPGPPPVQRRPRHRRDRGGSAGDRALSPRRPPRLRRSHWRCRRRLGRLPSRATPPRRSRRPPRAIAGEVAGAARRGSRLRDGGVGSAQAGAGRPVEAHGSGSAGPAPRRPDAGGGDARCGSDARRAGNRRRREGLRHVRPARIAGTAGCSAASRRRHRRHGPRGLPAGTRDACAGTAAGGRCAPEPGARDGPQRGRAVHARCRSRAPPKRSSTCCGSRPPRA